MTEVVTISGVVIIIIGGRCSANKWTRFYMITACHERVNNRSEIYRQILIYVPQ